MATAKREEENKRTVTHNLNFDYICEPILENIKHYRSNKVNKKPRMSSKNYPRRPQHSGRISDRSSQKPEER